MSVLWKQYLDEDFNTLNRVYLTRDKVVTKCPSCGKNPPPVRLDNLKAQIKRIGMHLCWSCSGKLGQEKRFKGVR